jgi:hypothetical protein
MALMNRSGRISLGLQMLVFAALAACAANGQDATSQIKTETQRLQQSLKDHPISNPDLPDLGSMVGDSLKTASDALNAGHLYFSLETLGRASDLLQGARVQTDKASAVKNNLPVFDSEWNKVSLDLTARDREARERDWDKSPAALRALSESAQGKAIPLLEGARGFATATKPEDGLFYMGQAQGEAEFARFCASVNLPRKNSPLPLRSFLPELASLQEKTNAAFQPPRSIDQHPRFISLNSTIKLAQELDASKFYAGSLYEYLEAVRHYGMLDAPVLDAAKQSELKAALAAQHRKLEQSERDDSIPLLFLERAQSQIAHADGSAPTADEWRSGQVVLDQVLPAYFATLKAPPALQQASGKTVDITLVRWPYT